MEEDISRYMHLLGQTEQLRPGVTAVSYNTPLFGAVKGELFTRLMREAFLRRAKAIARKRQRPRTRVTISP